MFKNFNSNITVNTKYNNRKYYSNSKQIIIIILTHNLGMEIRLTYLCVDCEKKRIRCIWEGCKSR